MAMSRVTRRRFVALTLGTVGASALMAACGGAPPAPTTAPAKTESKPAAAEPTKPAAAAAAEPTKPAAAAAATTAPAGAAAPTATSGTAPAPAAKPATSKAPITMRFTTWWVPLEAGLKDAGAQIKEKLPYLTVETEMITQ